MKRTKHLKSLLRALYPEVGFITIQGSCQEAVRFMLDLVLFAPYQTLMGLRLMTSLAKYTGNVNSVS